MAEVVTNTPLTISYFISDITSAVVTYNRMEWLRSRDGKDGAYYPATASAVASAVLTGTSKEYHSISGKTLSLLVDGTDQVDVTFAGPDPYTSAAAAAEISGATALLTAADVGGYVVLTSASTGSSASIKVLECDAGPYMGFAVGQAEVGLDQDSTLVPGTSQYFYTDNNSDIDFWYKIRLYHSVSGATSEYSVPIPASQVQAVSYSNTLVAYVRLADMQGRPMVGNKVIVSNTQSADVVDTYGIFKHYVELETDRNGYAETRLIKGLVLDVHVEGSGFTRRITLPTDQELVNLLDPDLVTEDEFGIQQTNINFAMRTS